MVYESNNSRLHILVLICISIGCNPKMRNTLQYSVSKQLTSRITSLSNFLAKQTTKRDPLQHTLITKQAKQIYFDNIHVKLQHKK